jgi:hypothetical protein
MTLQNHPGDPEFPVRSRSRHARLVQQRRRGMPGPNAARALLIVAMAIPLGAIGFALALTFWPDGTELANPFFGGVAGIVVGLIVASIISARMDAGAPLRAQRAYLAAAKSAPLTAAQQAILALDASSDFSFRGWNSSLAFLPTWTELPAALRARYEDGQKGSPWDALPMSALATLRADLDKGYKVASATDVEVLVADMLVTGPLSERFAEVSASPDGERMAARVAALSGSTEWDVRELAQPADGHPPDLLLAGDVERAIGAVRYAYVVGYLPADRAWELLGRIADKAFARYRGYDEYWNAAAVATAFRTDSLEAVQTQRQSLAGLRAAGWPAAGAVFPARGRAS